jgi:hypothetical protein
MMANEMVQIQTSAATDSEVTPAGDEAFEDALSIRMEPVLTSEDFETLELPTTDVRYRRKTLLYALSYTVTVLTIFSLCTVLVSESLQLLMNFANLVGNLLRLSRIMLREVLGYRMQFITRVCLFSFAFLLLCLQFKRSLDSRNRQILRW